MGYLTNETPASAAAANYNVKTTLNQGTSGTNWTITQSSNGTTWTPQGDLITSASVLAVAATWYVAQGRGYEDNGTTYYTQICVQTDGGRGLRVKVSFRAGFSGGSPSVTRVPAATDEVVLIGGGTDASPTYMNFWPASGSRQQGWADESDERCWFMSYPVGGGAANALMFIDRPEPNPTGSGGDLLDKERIVFYMATGASCALCEGLSQDDTAPLSMFLLGEAEQLWGRCPPAMLYMFDTSSVAQRYIPGGAASSSIYSEPAVPEMPFTYARRASLAGTLLSGEVGDSNTCDEKGTSTMIRYGGQRKSTPTLLDGVNPTSGEVETGSTLALGDVLVGWNGTALSV